MNEEDLRKIIEDNALPIRWESMEYSEFLVSRRKLMAAMIRKGFEYLEDSNLLLE